MKTPIFVPAREYGLPESHRDYFLATAVLVGNLQELWHNKDEIRDELEIMLLKKYRTRHVDTIRDERRHVWVCRFLVMIDGKSFVLGYAIHETDRRLYTITGVVFLMEVMHAL